MSSEARIYLDNATLSPPSETVVAAMIPFLIERWGSPFASYSFGQELLSPMEEAYRKIYQFLGGNDADTLILTSSRAEAITHVIAETYRDITVSTGKNHYITAASEDAPMILNLGRLEKQGCRTSLIPLNQNGVVTAESVGDLLTPRTALLSLSWTNPLTGLLNPVEEISDLCKERGIRFHLDISQALGKVPFSLEDLGADILTFQGSLLHAPKGIGAIYLRSGISLSPLILGGPEQAGFRAGELDVAALIGLGQAAEEVRVATDYLCTEVARLRNQFETGIQEGYQEAHILFSGWNRLPHVSVVAFPGIANEAMHYMLNRRNVFANIGGGEYQQIGHVLSAIGCDPLFTETALHFSLCRYTTETEVAEAVDRICSVARHLRQLSTNIVR